MQRVFFSVMLVVALAACATVAPERQVTLDTLAASAQPTIAAPGRLTVLDERPAEARRTHSLSIWVTDCNYAVRSLGDDRFASDRLARLESDLVSALGDALDGQRLVVRSYAIYLNRRGVNEAGAVQAGFGGGIIAGAIASQISPGGNAPVSLRPKCEEERMRGGWFQTSELTNNFSPLVTELDVSLGEEAYSVRSVLSPAVELATTIERNTDPVVVAALQQAMAKAHLALVTTINARRAPSVAEPAAVSN